MKVDPPRKHKSYGWGLDQVEDFGYNNMIKL